MGTDQPIFTVWCLQAGKLLFEFIKKKSALWIKEGNNEQHFVLQLEGDCGDWRRNLLPLVKELARQVENFRGYRLAGQSLDALLHWLGLGTLYVNTVYPY